MFDCIIVGGGPGALSAALNLKARNKDFILFAGNEKEIVIEKSHWIDNYLGLPDISGKDMMEKFRSHVLKNKIEIRKEKIYNILSMGEYFVLSNGVDFFEAKSIILAIGQSKALTYPGEDRYLGVGVGYCATCDGPLYRGKTVAIVSESREGEEEANFMAEICKKVYYIKTYSDIPDLTPDIEIINDKVKEISGDGNFAKKLVLENQEIDTDGIFIIRKVIPIGKLLEGIESEGGHISVNRDMETSLTGVFACGDCTGKPYQIAKAVGEGNVAALSVVRFLNEKR